MKSWIGVASFNHVERGMAGGFAQLCHGKGAPLRRMAPGDWLIYYSPKEEFGGARACRAFTAIGQINERPVYAHDMGGGFIPFRRDVTFAPAQRAPIAPLLSQLRFVREHRSWGLLLRRGHFEIALEDAATIAAAMQVPYGPPQ